MLLDLDFRVGPQDEQGNPEPCAKVMRELCERALDRHEEDEDLANGIEDELLDLVFRMVCLSRLGCVYRNF